MIKIELDSPECKIDYDAHFVINDNNAKYDKLKNVCSRTVWQADLMLLLDYFSATARVDSAITRKMK